MPDAANEKLTAQRVEAVVRRMTLGDGGESDSVDAAHRSIFYGEAAWPIRRPADDAAGGGFSMPMEPHGPAGPAEAAVSGKEGGDKNEPSKLADASVAKPREEARAAGESGPPLSGAHVSNDNMIMHVDEKGPTGAHSSHQSVAALIEGEVLPRLLLAHSDGVETSGAPSVTRSSLPSFDVDAFAWKAIEEPVAKLVDDLEALRAGGWAVDKVCLTALAGAARRLGDMWTEDACSFADVTMAVGKLTKALHWIGREGRPKAGEVRANRRVYLAAAPGDQHYFGVVMTETFFARAGWRTLCDLTVTREDILARVAAEPFEAVGLSVSCAQDWGDISQLTKAIRSASKNKNVSIFLGGSGISGTKDDEKSSIARQLCADAIATDATDAVNCAERLAQTSDSRSK